MFDPKVKICPKTAFFTAINKPYKDLMLNGDEFVKLDFDKNSYANTLMSLTGPKGEFNRRELWWNRIDLKQFVEDHCFIATDTTDRPFYQVLTSSELDDNDLILKMADTLNKDHNAFVLPSDFIYDKIKISSKVQSSFGDVYAVQNLDVDDNRIQFIDSNTVNGLKVGSFVVPMGVLDKLSLVLPKEFVGELTIHPVERNFGFGDKFNIHSFIWDVNNQTDIHEIRFPIPRGMERKIDVRRCDQGLLFEFPTQDGMAKSIRQSTISEEKLLVKVSISFLGSTGYKYSYIKAFKDETNDDTNEYLTHLPNFPTNIEYNGYKDSKGNRIREVVLKHNEPHLYNVSHKEVITYSFRSDALLETDLVIGILNTGKLQDADDFAYRFNEIKRTARHEKLPFVKTQKHKGKNKVRFMIGEEERSVPVYPGDLVEIKFDLDNNLINLSYNHDEILSVTHKFKRTRYRQKALAIASLSKNVRLQIGRDVNRVLTDYGDVITEYEVLKAHPDSQALKNRLDIQVKFVDTLVKGVYPEEDDRFTLSDLTMDSMSTAFAAKLLKDGEKIILTDYLDSLPNFTTLEFGVCNKISDIKDTQAPNPFTLLAGFFKINEQGWFGLSATIEDLPPIGIDDKIDISTLSITKDEDFIRLYAGDTLIAHHCILKCSPELYNSLYVYAKFDSTTKMLPYQAIHVPVSFKMTKE